jgi:predicted pyridoxine 5'-phosphate oxidase superfamily flavin-nucleotide-binding protein
MHTIHEPGSHGEHLIQERLGSAARARAFYHKQVLDYLNPRMQEFIGAQTLFFLASADGRGECDCTLRAGPAGFVRVLGERALAYPEYRGNGVYASLGNVQENPHLGLLFVDFVRDTIGLHVNGRARVWLPGDGPCPEALAAVGAALGPTEAWVVIDVAEAYVHCSKHIPLLARLSKDIDWGTDDQRRKGGDYFQARSCPRPW